MAKKRKSSAVPPQKGPDEARRPPRGVLDAAWGALLLCSVFLVYWPALRGGPVLDDSGHVTSPDLQSFHGLWRSWSDLGPVPQYYPRRTCHGSSEQRRQQRRDPGIQSGLGHAADEAVVRNSYGSALAGAGRFAQAVVEYKKSTEHSPEYPDAHNNLGAALSETGKLEEAIAHMQQAARLSGGRDPMILSFLGELYAKVGRVPEAVEVTGQALTIATQANDIQLARELQARMAAYQSRR